MNAQRPGVDHQPAGDAGGGDDRADRQVDARGGDHERHPDGQHADDARLGEHRPHVVGGGERVGLEDRADDEQHDDHDDERVLLQLARPSAATACPRARAWPRRWCRSPSASSPRRFVADPVAPASPSAACPASRGAGPRARWRRAPSSSATSSPSRMTRIRVHRPSSSSISDDTTITPSPWGQVGDDPEQLRLRRHVDAARRLVEQEHPALLQQPAGQHDLLLVAARELSRPPAAVVAAWSAGLRSCVLRRRRARPARGSGPAGTGRRRPASRSWSGPSSSSSAWDLRSSGASPSPGRDRAVGSARGQALRRRRPPRRRRGRSTP